MNSLEVLKAALMDLIMEATPYVRGKPANRTPLRRSLTRAHEVLRWADDQGVAHDMDGLRRAAALADALAKDEPGFRADLDG